MKGRLFENLIITEQIKQRYNQFLPPNIYYWRDKLGREVDCILEQNNQTIAIDIKAGKTITKDQLKNLKYWQSLSHADNQDLKIIYGGEQNQSLFGIDIISWRKAATG